MMTKTKTLATLLLCTACAASALAHTRQLNDEPSDQPASSPYSLREGWGVEAAVDMSNMLPYGLKASETFPKGRTHGISVGLTKRFSPQITIRARLNWENGIGLFRNNRLEWMVPLDPETMLSTNIDEGGCLFPYMDVLVSVPNFFAGYDPKRRWDVQIIPRAGMVINRHNNSTSPLLGMGCGFDYRLSRRVHAFADFTYEATTTDFVIGIPGAGTGMTVATGHNKILALHAGVHVDLGRLGR